MTLRFYMDHHVPSAITQGLRQRGIDVLTAHEDGAAQFDDEQLLERATQLGRTLLGDFALRIPNRCRKPKLSGQLMGRAPQGSTDL